MYICQNHDLKIRVFMVCKAPDLQSTNVNIRVPWPIFVMKMHDNPMNPDSYFMMTSSNANIFHVTGEFPPQRPVTRSFDIFFDLRPNNRLSKSWGWWFETPSRLFWRHCNVFVIYVAALCEPSCNLVAPYSILIIRLYVAIDFLHNIFSSGISWFLSNLFSAENQLRYLVVTLPKRVRGHPEVFLSCLSAAVLHA